MKAIAPHHLIIVSTLAWIVSVIDVVLTLSSLKLYFIPSHWAILPKSISMLVFILLSVLWIGYFLSKEKFRQQPAKQITDIWLRKEVVLMAILVFIGLLLSFVGDNINFNREALYFRHSDFVKHDYLADSVWFFAPAYGCFSYAAWRWLSANVSRKIRCLSLFFGCAIGLVSYLIMMDSRAGVYVLSMTGSYSMIIMIPAVLGFLLFKSSNQSRPKKPFIIVSLGLVLATLADALIGQFWIFGNNGQGYYPLIREVNWLVYITSQLLLLHLPWCYATAQLDRKYHSN
ncbi:hypothetical protein NI389_18965 (plasmid) [Pseudoalteromonas xiamenensis]|uniref:hypothetical protein n=1 Tax=Pseudoalteromonas xiamenensis TaxID=882626 RepID=UPI0027E57440|nr:hypothetical protein [Pseudoalteromonas xiamenensis]WMN61888.1 hypothetical protein NI389_18965 [Pseudoalteromonas xiamenensis]